MRRGSKCGGRGTLAGGAGVWRGCGAVGRWADFGARCFVRLRRFGGTALVNGLHATAPPDAPERAGGGGGGQSGGRLLPLVAGGAAAFAGGSRGRGGAFNRAYGADLREGGLGAKRRQGTSGGAEAQFALCLRALAGARHDRQAGLADAGRTGAGGGVYRRAGEGGIGMWGTALFLPFAGESAAGEQRGGTLGGTGTARLYPGVVGRVVLGGANRCVPAGAGGCGGARGGAGESGFLRGRNSRGRAGEPGLL